MSTYQEKKRSLFFWAFFGVIIPIFIVGTIAIFILYMAGVDVVSYAKDKLNQIPVVSTLVTDDSEQAMDQKIIKAQQKISEQKKEIANLEDEVTHLEGLVDEWRIKDKQRKQSEKTASDKGELAEAGESIKQITSSFRKMEPKKAAEIIQQMDDTNALKVLEEMSGDKKGAILAEMDAKEAAKWMEKLMQK